MYMRNLHNLRKFEQCLVVNEYASELAVFIYINRNKSVACPSAW